MARWDIGGTWAGRYSYSCGAGFTALPPPVRFTLTARAGWFGFFSGTIVDDSAVVPDGRAEVRGRVSGWAVSFDKQYATLWVFHEGRCISLREYLDRELGLSLDEEVPGSSIEYRGQYDPAEQIVRGTWRILPVPIEFTCRGRPYHWGPATATGEWEARCEFE